MTDDDFRKDIVRWFARSPLLGPLDSPRPGAHVEAIFGAQSRRGPLRQVNDDHYLVMRMGRHEETLLTSLSSDDIPARFDEAGYGMVIADGLGDDGQASSRLAISTLVNLYISFGKWNLRINEPISGEAMDRAKRFYRAIDSALLRSGAQGSGGLQTTLTAVFTAGSDLLFAHVGHSRAYLFRDGELMQLTRDHTLEHERRRSSLIVDVATKPRDLGHIVIDALGAGGSGSPRIDIERLGLLDGDIVLLCTNGLTDVADTDRIVLTLESHKTPVDQCRALVDLATESGTNDDVTVVIGHYQIRT